MKAQLKAPLSNCCTLISLKHRLHVCAKAEDELQQTRGWSRLVPRGPGPDQDYLPRTYGDLLLGAWEARHGASEAAREEGRQRLRSLCQDRHHLVVNTNKT